MDQSVTRYVLMDEAGSCNIGVPTGVWQEARHRSEEDCAIDIGTVEYMSSNRESAGYFQMRLFILSLRSVHDVWVIKAFHHDVHGVELDDDPFILWEGFLTLFGDSTAPSLKDMYLNFAFYWLKYMGKRSHSWKKLYAQGKQRWIS